MVKKDTRTPGRKAADTKKRKKAAAAAVRTRTAKGGARKAVQTRKWKRVQGAAQAEMAALAAGDIETARQQLEIIAGISPPASH